MHNNGFEHQVEQQMGELKFNPSESVWQKVEQQIRVRKRRRRFFFWWLPAILLGTGLSIWGINTMQDEKIQDKRFKVQELRGKGQEEKVQDTREMPEGTSSKVQGTNKKIQDSKEKVQGAIDKIQEDKVVEQIHITDNIVQTTRAKRKVQHITNTIAIVKQQKEKIAIEDKASIIEKQAINQPVVISQPNEPTGTAPVVLPKPAIKKDEPVVEEKINNALETKPVQPIVNQQDSLQEQKNPAIAETKALSTSRKWMLNLVLRGGVAHMSPFAENMNKSNALYSSPATSGGGGSNSSFGDSSITKTGPSFSVGFELKKPMGKRSFLSAGLDYGFYSSAHKTGQQVNASAQISTSITNSSFDRYNTAGTTSLYRDRYHLIEIPLLYTLQLTKAEKRPIQWQGGLAYSLLFSSNAQYYSRSGFIYYYDQKLFQRSQFQLRTAFTIGLLKKEDYPLQLGVEYQYNVSGQWKPALDLNQHLSFTGLRLSWRINK